jgi:uncharacterized protein YmfQ (DUF2313 family)
MKTDTKDGRRVYRCNAYNLSGECSHACSIKLEKADDYVEAAFRRRFDPKKLRFRKSQQTKTLERKLTTLTRRVDEITQALDSIADMRYVKGSMLETEYMRQWERYAGMRAKAEEEADEIRRAMQSTTAIDVTALELWEQLDPLVKRQVLRRWIEQVVIHPASAGRWTPTDARIQIAWAP